MGIRQDLRTYQHQLARGVWLIVMPLLVLPMLVSFILQRSVPPASVPKWVWVSIPVVALAANVIYVAWTFILRPQRLGHRCPYCSQTLTGYAARVVIDTARCPRCQTDLS
jgi:uncharacterized membrane protein